MSSAAPTPKPAATPAQAPSAPAPAPKPATVAAPVPPKPDPVRAKELAAKVAEKFPDVKVEWMKERRIKFSTTPAKVKDVSIFVRDGLGFDHISTVSGVDWIGKNLLEVDYFVGSSHAGWLDFVVCVSELVQRDNPVVPTLVDVWLGSDYHERETHEMFGINFQGHPNQSHILLPEDWNDLPPLRKDYVSPGR